MSLAVRVIPCLDVDAGRVVKGVHFENLKDAGDPVELAAEYYRQGADEITFLDVTASSSHRNTMIDVVSRHRRTGVHPNDCGRRRTHARGRRLAAALRCRQGRCQHGRPSTTRRLSAVWPIVSATRCWCSPWMPAAKRVSSIRSPVLRSPRWAAANPPVLMPSGGSSAPSSLAPARFCLTRWTPTAPRKALTSR